MKWEPVTRTAVSFIIGFDKQPGAAGRQALAVDNIFSRDYFSKEVVHISIHDWSTCSSQADFLSVRRCPEYDCPLVFSEPILVGQSASAVSRRLFLLISMLSSLFDWASRVASEITPCLASYLSDR